MNPTEWEHEFDWRCAEIREHLRFMGGEIQELQEERARRGKIRELLRTIAEGIEIMQAVQLRLGPAPLRSPYADEWIAFAEYILHQHDYHGPWPSEEKKPCTTE